MSVEHPWDCYFWKYIYWTSSRCNTHTTASLWWDEDLSRAGWWSSFRRPGGILWSLEWRTGTTCRSHQAHPGRRSQRSFPQLCSSQTRQRMSHIAFVVGRSACVRDRFLTQNKLWNKIHSIPSQWEGMWVGKFPEIWFGIFLEISWKMVNSIRVLQRYKHFPQNEMCVAYQHHTASFVCWSSGINFYNQFGSMMWWTVFRKFMQQLVGSAKVVSDYASQRHEFRLWTGRRQIQNPPLRHFTCIFTSYLSSPRWN